MRQYGGDLARVQNPEVDGDLSETHRILALQFQDLHDLVEGDELHLIGNPPKEDLALLLGIERFDELALLEESAFDEMFSEHDLEVFGRVRFSIK